MREMMGWKDMLIERSTRTIIGACGEWEKERASSNVAATTGDDIQIELVFGWIHFAYLGVFSWIYHKIYKIT